MGTQLQELYHMALRILGVSLALNVVIVLKKSLLKQKQLRHGIGELIMPEYIEKDVVINDIGELFTICYETLPNEYGHHFIVEEELQTHLDFIRNLPAADVAEVKHGKWIWLADCANEGLYCSNCHVKISDHRSVKKKLSNYCPNCGAKMEGEE